MQTPVNPFKQALREKRPQIGLWLGLADHYATEICAGAGFDWLLVDGEHSPNDLRSILQQAQVIAAYPQSHAIARVPVGHGNVGTALIKQYLDLGIQTLLVPMVDTAQQAADLVRASRYPPGASAAWAARALRAGGAFPTTARKPTTRCACWCRPRRARRWTTWTRSRLRRAWTACSSARPIFPLHWATSATPRIRKCRPRSRTRSAASRRPARPRASCRPTRSLARRYLELGATFVAVGLDTNLLVRATSALAAKFKAAVTAAPESKTY